jgi:hypothetical protein
LSEGYRFGKNQRVCHLDQFLSGNFNYVSLNNLRSWTLKTAQCTRQNRILKNSGCLA